MLCATSVSVAQQYQARLRVLTSARLHEVERQALARGERKILEARRRAYKAEHGLFDISAPFVTLLAAPWMQASALNPLATVTIAELPVEQHNLDKMRERRQGANEDVRDEQEARCRAPMRGHQSCAT